MIDIISKIIIPLLGAIVAYVLIPYIKSKTSNEDLEKIYSWVKIAVYSAEQMEKAGLINIPKKDFVINFLNEKGFDISTLDREVLIESAVRELKLIQEEWVK